MAGGGKMVLRVDGMTCSNCEKRIEEAVRRVPGVAECRASYARGALTVFFSGNPAEEEIRQAVEALGYSLRSSEARAGFGVKQLLGIGIILVAVLLVAGRTGIFTRIPEVSPAMGYGMLFVIGLLTSLHCVGMCGGINLSQSVNRAVSGRLSTLARIKPGLLYNAGRVVSYTLIGGLAGALGSAVSVSGKARGILVIAVGGFMVLMGLNQLDLFPWLRRLTPRLPRLFRRAAERGGSGPFTVGLLNGLMPCGPLQSMQLYALGTGSFAAGSLSMGLFSLGTVPLVLGLGTLGSLLTRRFARRLVQVSALLVMLLGVAMVGRGLSQSGVDLRFWRSGPGAEASIARFDGGVQVVQTTLEPGRYRPIVVQKGIPVKWTISASPSSLNGCNNPVTVPAYGITRRLEPGPNTIEFTPAETGSILYTCWMGMISSTILVVDDVRKVTARDVRNAERSARSGPPGGGGGCCAPGETELPEGFTVSTDKIGVARIAGGIQRLEIEVTREGYSPQVVVMERGVPAEWAFRVRDLTEENYRIVFPTYQARLELEKGDNVVTLTPEADFYFSSWKGGLHGYVRVVDDLGSVRAKDVREYVRRRMEPPSLPSL